jgi:hypothetical protein
MESRAYIHIGTSKTGTTSIQRSMAQHAARLREQYSVNYPRVYGNHMVLGLPFLGGHFYQPIENHMLRHRATRDGLMARAEALLAGLTRDAQRYETHVLSAEQLEFLHPEPVGRIKAFFEGIGLPVSIIVYVRHPAERLSSLMAQRIRSGRFSLRTFEVTDDVLPVLKTFAGAFGKDNLIVRRFSPRHFVNGRLIDDFTATFHGTPIDGMTELRENESLSTPAVLIADRLFDIAPLTSGKRASEAWMHRIAGPKFVAPRALVEQAVAASRDLFEYLDTEFGIRFDEVDLSRFPESVSTEFPLEALLSLAELLNEQGNALQAIAEAPARRRLSSLVKRLFRRRARV